ncbi:MAG: protoporphyrinogen oxidase [Cytophagaceae bacterium]|nr:protoporphyrinogen oxidase [Cytophagaceae bacterium]
MVLIIGAGISGLSAAWHLQKHGMDYLLVEANDKPGGYIKTIQTEGYVLELGPNSILCDQEILDFFKDTKCDQQLVEAKPVSKARYIYRKGAYRKLPDNPASLLFSGFFSFSSKLKILAELFKKPENIPGETLDAFFNRRLGKEISDYALNPFVQGVYAGNPSRLLVETTFPVLKEYESKYGSIIKGLIKNKPGRKKSFNFKNGMQELPSAIAAQLKNIQYSARVNRIVKSENGYEVSIQEPAGVRKIKANTLVITTPPFVAAELLSGLYPQLAQALKRIEYPAMCAVHTVFNKSDVEAELNGFGVLNPYIENQFSSGCIWNSSIFSARCPADKVLFTNFVGGSLHQDKIKLPDDEILKNVKKELIKNFQIRKEPVFQKIYRIEKAIPQYNLKVKTLNDFLPNLEKNSIFFSANYINGVSLSDCIKKGKRLADKIFKLQSR